MSTFIEDLLAYTQPYESATSFWRWAGYVSVGVALRDNCWIADGDNKLFPNIYVLFLASSGGRKDRPIRLCESLVTELTTIKVISGRASIQGILDELARSETHAKTGKVTPSGSALYVAPELAAGIVEDNSAVSVLTDIYDGKTNFQSILRHSPKFRIDRIVFSALMGSNEHMLKGVYDGRATYGGLLARTLLVVPDEIRPPNSLMGMNNAAIQDSIKTARDGLIAKLRTITEMRGAFFFAEDAIDEHERWYKPFYYSFTRGGDKAGVSARIQTNIKKMSMILAANAGEQTIRRPHMVEAVELCTGLLKNYNNLIMGTGKSSLAEVSALVIKTLSEQDGYLSSKKEILAMHWSDIDSETLEKVVNTLLGGGIIDTYADKLEIYIRLTPKTRERLGLK